MAGRISTEWLKSRKKRNEEEAYQPPGHTHGDGSSPGDDRTRPKTASEENAEGQAVTKPTDEMKESKTAVHVAKLVLLLPLVLYLGFIIPEKKGWWDHVTGLDSAREVAERFERSVGPDDAVPVRAGQKEFDPVISLIKQYSSAKLAGDRVYSRNLSDLR